MKKLTNSALLMLIFSLVALFSCNDPSEIGSDLLAGDQLDTEFTDTISLRARTVLNDSLVVWGPGVNGVVFQNFAFGDFQDPIFGRTVSSIFTQIVSSGNAPMFKDTVSVLDSIVLTLVYNKDLAYGKVDEPFTVEVYEMDQSLDVAERYLTSDSFSVKPMPLAVHTFTPNLTDSLTVKEPNADTVREVRLAPHLRIRLDSLFGKTLLGTDSLTVITDTLFLQVLKGLWIKPASQNAGMLSFNMRNVNTNLRLYYSDGLKKKSYDFHVFSDNPVVLHQRNYYGGSQVADFINLPGEERNDEKLFLQGLNGVNIEFEIPYAEALNNVIINKAELVLPILNDDTDDFDPVAQMYVTEVLSDTSEAILDDIYLVSISRVGADFGDYFGGKVKSDDTYVLNLGSQLQRMISGDSKKKIRITAHFRSERAARVVLGGATNPDFPAKLRIRYTKY